MAGKIYASSCAAKNTDRRTSVAAAQGARNPQMLNLYTITSTFTEFFTFLAPFLNKSCTKQHTYGVGAAATGNRAHFRHFENTQARPHARLLVHSASVSCIM
jgi:hypothetical protein